MKCEFVLTRSGDNRGGTTQAESRNHGFHADFFSEHSLEKFRANYGSNSLMLDGRSTGQAPLKNDLPPSGLKPGDVQSNAEVPLINHTKPSSPLPAANDQCRTLAG